jgi:hypothetical protein
MDYCHPCRRHLNGALACPGCGTPVEELLVYADAHEDDADSAAEGFETAEVPYEGHGDEGVRPGRAQSRRRGASGGPDGARGTRAARRDRKAAAHRRRRRRVLFAGAGLLLAAGGLSLAELGIEAPGSAPKPAAAGDETADGPGSAGKSAGRSDGGGAVGIGDATSASASASPSPSDSAKGEKSGEGKKPTGEATRSAPATGSPGRPTSAPTATRPSGTAPAPGPTSTIPKPQPSPTKTCNRFLFWCT